MIIDQHQLASGFDHPQRFAQGLPARRRRLLVQQEEKYRLVVAGIVEAERGRVALMQGYRRRGREFLPQVAQLDRKSTRLNSSHANISYAVFCLKKKKEITRQTPN